MKTESRALNNDMTTDRTGDIFVGWTTVADTESAHRLAESLIEASLAACVQIDSPVTSHYRWKGQSCQGAEIRLWVKTTEACLPAIGHHFNRHHPYDLPQWVAVRASDVSTDYADWVRKSVSPGSS